MTGDDRLARIRTFGFQVVQADLSDGQLNAKHRSFTEFAVDLQ